MVQISEQNSENHVEGTSAPPLSTNPKVLGESPRPSFVGEDHAPAYLASLGNRACVYGEAASFANMRKAYAGDWGHFSA